ncbi:MAG: hypothetical protein JW940_16100 [Polyangiaceae bacterium]|nr:hypothetical protein [Polyangiaceae bacterium]
MDRRRQTRSTAVTRSAVVGLALVVALEGCGGSTGHAGERSAEQTGGVVGTSGAAGLDTAQGGSGGAGRSAAGGTVGATSGGRSGGAAAGGAGTATGGTTGGTETGGTPFSSGGASSPAAGGTTARGGARAQAGTGGTSGTASGGSGGSVAGGAGTATGGTSSSAAAAGSAGAAGTSRVDELIGTWEGSGYIGNCVYERQFLTFEDPDQVSYADWNDDACTGPALMGSKSGTFAVSGRHTLEITWDFSEDPRDEATARCIEAYPFAMGVSTQGTPGIVRDLFVQLDARTWQYRTLDQCYTVSGMVLEGTLVDFELSFDAPVPLTGSGTCQMTARAEVARESKTTDDNSSYAADLYVVPCVVEPSDGRQHVRFAGFVGAEPADEYQIWQDFLEQQGYQQAHPDWVLALLNGVFFPDLTLDPADPTYLCEYGCTPEWVASEGMTAR